MRSRAASAGRSILAQLLARESLDGVALVNVLRVEPELGTPSRGGSMATVARRTADGWRISGHKIYSTGLPILKWYSVWARTDETEPRHGDVPGAGRPAGRDAWSRPGITAACAPAAAMT